MISKTHRDLAASLVSQIGYKIIGFLTVALLARHLSQEDYGKLGFCLSFCTLGILFTDLGLSTDVVRKVASEPDSARKRLSRLVSARTPLFLGFIVFSNAILAATKPELLTVSFGITIYAVLKDCHRSFSAVFIARKRIGRNILSFGVGITITLLGVAASKFLGLGLSCVVAFYILGGLAMLTISFTQFSRDFGVPKIAVSLRSTRTQIFSAFSLFIVTGLSYAHFSIDTILLGYLRPYDEVAHFEAAARLHEASQFIIRPLTLIMFPICSELAACANWTRLFGIMNKMYVVCIFVGLVASLGSLLLAAPIVTFVFSSGFLDSAQILKILYASAPAFFLTSVGIFVAASLNRERHACYAIGTALLLKLIFELWLVPTYGAQACAWTNLGTQSLAALWLAIDSYRAVTKRKRSNCIPVSH